MIKKWILLICVLLVTISNAIAFCPCGFDDEGFCLCGNDDGSINWDKFSEMANSDPSLINNLDPTQALEIKKNLKKLNANLVTGVFEKYGLTDVSDADVSQFLPEVIAAGREAEVAGRMGDPSIQAAVEEFLKENEVEYPSEMGAAYIEEVYNQDIRAPNGAKLSCNEDGVCAFDTGDGNPTTVNRCPTTRCDPIIIGDPNIIGDPSQGAVVEVSSGANIDFSNYPIVNIDGNDIDLGLELDPIDRSYLLSGKMNLEGGTNVTYGPEWIKYSYARKGNIEAQYPDGSYVTNFKNGEGITVYQNGTFEIDHAELLEMTHDDGINKNQIIIVNGDDISFDGNELHVGASDSVIINNRTVAINPEDFYGYLDYNGYPGYPIISEPPTGDFIDFKFNSSDAVIIGEYTYPNLLDSEFLLDKGDVIYFFIALLCAFGVFFVACHHGDGSRTSLAFARQVLVGHPVRDFPLNSL